VLDIKKFVLYNISVEIKKNKKGKAGEPIMTNEIAKTDLKLRAEKRTYEFNDKNHEYVAFYVVVNGIPIDVKIKDKVGRIMVLQALGFDKEN